MQSYSEKQEKNNSTVVEVILNSVITYILIYIGCFVSVYILKINLKIHNFLSLETGDLVFF